MINFCSIAFVSGKDLDLDGLVDLLYLGRSWLVSIAALGGDIEATELAGGIVRSLGRYVINLSDLLHWRVNFARWAQLLLWHQPSGKWKWGDFDAFELGHNYLCLYPILIDDSRFFFERRAICLDCGCPTYGTSRPARLRFWYLYEVIGLILLNCVTECGIIKQRCFAWGTILREEIVDLDLSPTLLTLILNFFGDSLIIKIQGDRDWFELLSNLLLLIVFWQEERRLNRLTWTCQLLLLAIVVTLINLLSFVEPLRTVPFNLRSWQTQLNVLVFIQSGNWLLMLIWHSFQWISQRALSVGIFRELEALFSFARKHFWHDLKQLFFALPYGCCTILPVVLQQDRLVKIWIGDL